MNSTPSIQCALPYCRSFQEPQTKTSLTLRITAIALGTILLTTSLLIFLNVSFLSHLGTIGGVSFASVGSISLLLGSLLKQVRNIEIQSFMKKENNLKEEGSTTYQDSLENEGSTTSQDLSEDDEPEIEHFSEEENVVGSNRKEPEDNSPPQPPVTPTVSVFTPNIQREARTLQQLPELAPPQETKIHSGYGEFILCSKRGRTITHTDYTQAYTTLHQHSLSYLLENFEGEELEKAYGSRGKNLQQEIEQINSDWSVFFVPRTLYELTFIHACIEEDLQAGAICPMFQFHTSSRHNSDNGDYAKCYSKELNKVLTKRAVCWHRCKFNDAGNPSDEKVVLIAHQINQIFLEMFAKTNTILFTHLEIALQEEIAYLSEYFGSAKGEELVDCNEGGPGTNFQGNSSRGIIKSLGIKTEAQKTIVSNTLALECSELAQNHLFLFRGIVFENDFPDHHNKPYSLSYGSSLYAGFLYDGGATSFHYMRQKDLDAFVTSLPISEVKQSPFYYPVSTTVCQFYGKGEIFHGRSRSWKNGGKPGGLRGTGNKWQHLKSDISQEQFLQDFEKYYREHTYSLKD
ncbi:MAG: hypothetical protein K940chlam9_01712 [Chlamydiae bacterium]|nr:hypothetical protein [Chlamydiota bacterium]